MSQPIRELGTPGPDGDRRTLRKVRTAVFLTLAIVVLALWAWRNSRIFGLERALVPPEIAPSIAAVRQYNKLPSAAPYSEFVAWLNQFLPVGTSPSRYRGLSESQIELLKTWVAGVVVKGRSKREEVVAIFGKRFQNLDFPPRVGSSAIQVLLAGGGNPYGTYLVFEFEEKTGFVTNWYTSQSICGACPHILSDDGRWRLEGKMLAGQIGADAEGTDSLLLPRLPASGERLRVKLWNPAPEEEFIDQVQLGSVGLSPGEELDVGFDGRPYVWRQTYEFQKETLAGLSEPGAITLPLDAAIPDQVLVLELRNTTTFESVMRSYVFGHVNRAPNANLQVQFGAAAPLRVGPVGTKFLRRTVLPVPKGASSVQLHAPAGLWHVRRIWLGRGQVSQDVIWQTATVVEGPNGNLASVIRARDQRRLRLKPMEEAVLVFSADHLPRSTRRIAHLLRMVG